MISSAHFCKGIFLKVAFIFSAPGRHEEEKQLPVSGQTGKNLHDVIHSLKSNGLFTAYNSIHEFRITNAIATIEYKSNTGRTEANKSEIIAEPNLRRLLDELNDIEDMVICFGNKSHIAINAIKNKLRPDLKIIKVRHLSPLSFNKIKGTKTHTDRVEFISNAILNQLSIH